MPSKLISPPIIRWKEKKTQEHHYLLYQTRLHIISILCHHTMTLSMDRITYTVTSQDLIFTMFNSERANITVRFYRISLNSDTLPNTTVIGGRSVSVIKGKKPPTEIVSPGESGEKLTLSKITRHPRTYICFKEIKRYKSFT